MGKINEGFTGGFVGKVGNTVGYQWRGKWCIRMRAATIHDARSKGQLEQRDRFKQMVSFAGRAKEALQKGLRLASKEHGMTECNYFMRLNNSFFTTKEEGMAIDYDQLMFSQGPVAPVAFTSVEMVGDTTMRIAFEKNPLHRVAGADDEVYVVLYFPETGLFHLAPPTFRKAKKIDIELNEEWDGLEMHLWGFVRDAAGRASETQYIGCGEPVDEADDALPEEVSGDVQTASATKASAAENQSKGGSRSRKATAAATPPE